MLKKLLQFITLSKGYISRQPKTAKMIVRLIYHVYLLDFSIRHVHVAVTRKVGGGKI